MYEVILKTVCTFLMIDFSLINRSDQLFMLATLLHVARSAWYLYSVDVTYIDELIDRHHH